MDEKQEYALQLVAQDWQDKLIANYDLFIERAKKCEKEMLKQKDPAKLRAAGAVRDRHLFAAEGLLLALDILGYAFDGEEILPKWGDIIGKRVL